MAFTYPTIDKVNELIETDFSLSSENSEDNYECMKMIFYGYTNTELVKQMGELINDKGGFKSLQSNFYILCKVLKYILNNNPEREPELHSKFIIIRDCVKSAWIGVGNWQC